jgi:hypothetical protein
MRKFIIASSIAAALVVWGLIPAVIQFVAQRELLRLQTEGLRLKVTELSGARIGFSAESIEGWASIPTSGRGTFPISYRLDHVSTRLSFPLTHPWSPDATLTATAYAGAIDAEVGDILGSQTISGTLAGLELSQHPQLQAFGVERGALRASVINHPLTPFITTPASYSIELKGLSVLLPPMVRDIIKITSIQDGQLTGQASLQTDGRFTLSSWNLSSSVGKASLTGQGKLARLQSLEELSGRVRVNLSGPDGERIAPWLPLISNQRVQSSQRSFGCTFQVLPCDRLTTYDFRSGPLCSRITWDS